MLPHEVREADLCSERLHPRYRALTGPAADASCDRVSEALNLGYELHGSPAATYDSQ
ncbi:MAG: DUF1737 domain-containing protein [Actinomycetota bacterium]|nr:DUF1737 domain-containing protein [Actinomycetota bacterium]